MAFHFVLLQDGKRPSKMTAERRGFDRKPVFGPIRSWYKQGMTVLLQNLSYAIGFACLLFAVHLFNVRPVKRAPSLLLGALFCIFAMQSVLLAVILTSPEFRIAAIVRPSLAMTIGPVLLLYYTSAADPDFRMRPVHMLHFLPAPLIGAQIATQTFVVNIDYAIILSFAAYTITLLVRARRGAVQFAHLGERRDDAFRWLIIGMSLLGVSTVAETLIYLDVIRGSELGDSLPLLIVRLLDLVIVGFAVTAALRRPSPFDWLYEFGVSLAPRRSSQLSDAECNVCADTFERLVMAERLFTEEHLPLQAAAKRLGVPARRLSESINRIHGESYSRYMNRLRIQEAKRLIVTEPDRSMLQVMLDSGFRTKSTFNREFRAATGMSPTEYRKAAPGSRGADGRTDELAIRL